MQLPYCILQQINLHSPGTPLLLHRFYVPYKEQRLACFVTDLQGNVLERVFYGKDRRYWQASQVIEKALCVAIRKELRLAA
ncbi:hypothetical protein [Bowmanella dokdonensis]|uniref:Uncharacterized protein n=1 Tax=Bowmanella dokdonensis TaxID=751969 RepID=A0A939DSZ6_9ALTE|nr:hypothetical protein [Bowmanella dokdonensis]MBN7827376.1 hypothetical protein [Bowmanella dokdonensis]